jgi:hypothetical protein
MKGWLIGMTVVLGVSVAAEGCATPLYGGYNGLSTSWVEYKIGDVETSLTASSILFGADSNERSWVRTRVSLVPLFMRLEYTRDHLGIQSVAFNTLFPWPVQLGSEIMETPGEIPPWWVTAYLILGVGGIDSQGNSWAETGIPGVYGVGADIAGNQWFWFKVSNFLRGFGEDYTPVEPEGVSRDNDVVLVEQSLRSLQGLFEESVGKQLAVRLNAPEFACAAARCSLPLHPAASLFPRGSAPAAEVNRGFDPSCAGAVSELFAGEIEEDLAILLEDFVRVVQPLLRKPLPPH